MEVDTSALPVALWWPFLQQVWVKLLTSLPVVHVALKGRADCRRLIVCAADLNGGLLSKLAVTSRSQQSGQVEYSQNLSQSKRQICILLAAAQARLLLVAALHQHFPYFQHQLPANAETHAGIDFQLQGDQQFIASLPAAVRSHSNCAVSEAILCKHKQGRQT